MDDMFSEMLEEFMGSALVTWVLTFDSVIDGEGPISTQYLEVNSSTQNAQKQYLELTNGIFLNEVMRVIDPNPKVERIFQNGSNDEVLRVQNFSVLNRHLRSYYQENLQQLILMPLPNVAVLGRDPLTEAALEELRKLLLLLLGSAVQCERKEEFIQNIQALDIKTQASIASCIQEVTQDPSNVLPLQWGELCALQANELQGIFSSMAQHIQSLLAQRDANMERIAELCREHDSAQGTALAVTLNCHSDDPPQGLAVQLADSRAKLRRLRQELEDKGDQLLDYKQEQQAMEAELKKLRQENRTLQGEVRVVRSLRDELDCLRDRAAKADRLQAELQNCAHRLHSLDLYRTQLQEQQQYCATLQETRALLEEQLGEARARCSILRELERDNLLLRQRLMDVEAERDTERQRVEELLEVNMGLETELKHSQGQVRGGQQPTVESDDELGRETISSSQAASDLKPLSMEVSEASSWRLLGAEHENMELRRRLEQLQAERQACTDSADSACVASADLLEEKEKLSEELQKEMDRRATLEKKHQDVLNELQILKKERERLEEQSEEGGGRGEVVKSQPREGGEGGQEAEGLGKEPGEGTGTREIGTEREDGEGEEMLSLKEKRGDREEFQAICKKREDGEGKKEAERTNRLKEKREEDRNGEAIRTKEGKEGEREAGRLAERERTEGKEWQGIPEGEHSSLGQQLQLALQEVERQSQEAERQASLAQDLRSKLGEQIRRAAGAEQRLCVLEAEVQRLRKAAESLAQARKQIEALQSEAEQAEEELMRLRAQVELQRLEGAVMVQFQAERAQLERERDGLRCTVDSLRAGARKGDQLELTNQALKAELERLSRNLETARRREEELQAELREAGLEAEALGRGRDEAALEASRLEQEKEACLSQLDVQRREQRQRERELARLRQQLESTASALEHSNQRACSLEAEHRRVYQELSQLKEDCTQLRELEEQNRQLDAQVADTRAQLSALGQELAKEKMQCQELANQLASEQVQAHDMAGQLANEKLKSQEADSQLAGMKTQLRELANQLAELREENERLEAKCRLSPSSLKGTVLQEVGPGTDVSKETHDRNGRACGDTGPEPEPQNQKERGSLSECRETAKQQLSVSRPRALDVTVTSDTLEAKRLIEVERQNAALNTEKAVLLSQLSHSQSTCAQLQEQLDGLRRQAIVLQESCTNLQVLNTKLQMEQASLSSQHASLWSRCSESEARVAALEAEARVWAKDREEVLMRGEGLRRDHERLTALQQRQEAELEALLSKHSQLKSSTRNLEAEHRELEGRYKELLDRKTLLDEREEVIRVEREKMERERQAEVERVRETERLREENERLHIQQKESTQVQAELLSQGSVLRGELSAAQLERTRVDGELSLLREQYQQLDLNNARLTSQYQLLTQLKGNLEEETRHLVEQNQSLARENRVLLERSLESQDQHHQQHREFTDKLNELRREKQKLVEKIMDQYRVLEPSIPVHSKAKKSNWIADRMKKLIKSRAGKEGRDGRTQFIAAGSIENLNEISDCLPTAVSAHAPDPLSAPGSPTPLRRAPGEGDDQPRGVARSGRRKLGSRHGWGLGVARGISQSFSPGDRHVAPRDRFRSQGTSVVVWEEGGSSTPSQESLTEEGKVESEDSLTALHNSDSHCVTSGAEDCHSSNDKLDMKKEIHTSATPAVQSNL